MITVTERVIILLNCRDHDVDMIAEDH
jgi:hypothetical protein